MSNSNNKRTVSTTNTNLRNGKADIPSALNVVYWDDGIKLEFCPELPKDQQTESRRYDYEHTVMTTLSRPKCNELYNLYEEKLKPAIVEGKNIAVSVPIANVHQLQIGTGVGADGVPAPFIRFIKNISPETLTAEEHEIVKYVFNRGEYVLDYDPTTGKYTDRVFTYNEFDLFMKDMKSFITAGSNAYVHTHRVVERYSKETTDNKLNKIGEKLGLDLAYRPRYGANGGGGQGSIFDNRPSNATPPQGQTTINDMNALDAALGIDDIDPMN